MMDRARRHAQRHPAQRISEWIPDFSAGLDYFFSRQTRSNGSRQACGAIN